MMINRKNIKIPCSKCNSKNTEAKSKNAYFKELNSSKNIFSKIVNTLFSTADTGFENRLGGQYAIICKDCGHVSLIFMN